MCTTMEGCLGEPSKQAKTPTRSAYAESVLGRYEFLREPSYGFLEQPTRTAYAIMFCFPAQYRESPPNTKRIHGKRKMLDLIFRTWLITALDFFWGYLAPRNRLQASQPRSTVIRHAPSVMTERTRRRARLHINHVHALSQREG